MCRDAPTGAIGLNFGLLSHMFSYSGRSQSEGWPHHGRTFSIYLCPLSFWLTLPRIVLSTYWCCPSRSCVAWSSWPACTWHCSLHYLFFQATPLFPNGVTIVCKLPLTVSNSSSLLQALLRTHSFVFFLLSTKTAESFSALSSQIRQDVFLHFFECPAFTAVHWYRPH